MCWAAARCWRPWTGSKFTLHGTFTGLATQATDAHLCMGTVMGGTGPAIYDVSVTQAQSGQVSGTVTLTQSRSRP